MKYTLNKVIIFFFFIFISIFIISNIKSKDISLDYTDTVNIRKAFFYTEENWDKYVNKVVKKIDNNNKIGFICNIDNDNYEMLFYPANNGWKDIYSFGRISYQFNKEKELLKVKVYFQSNNNSYLLFDKDNKGHFDAYLFGKLYRKDLVYYNPIDSLKYISLTAILSLLEKNNIDKELLINKDDSKFKYSFIKKVIKPSMGKKYADDGAIDQYGKYVYISNLKEQSVKDRGLNCSGFLKEVAENYIRLYKKDHKNLNINELKHRREKERENISYQYLDLEYDPFFGLDWSKNIADKINEMCELDIISSEEIQNDKYLSYFRNRGYKTEDIKEIIFRNQQKDPSNFYILIFNKLRRAKPIIPEFHHISIIVPYFKDHHFYIRVFESNEETGFNNLISLHKNEMVSIIKVPIPLALM